MQPPSPLNAGNAAPRPDSTDGRPTVLRGTGSLLIVGASVRAAVASACRAGCRPIAADLFADWDLRRAAPARRVTHYPDGLWQACAGLPGASWMYTGALENFPDLIDRMESALPLLGNSAAVLRQVRDPWRLAAPARDAGWRFPEIRPLGDRPTGGQWLRKPFRSANGAGIRPWQLPAARSRGAGQAGREVEPLGSQERTHYLQQFVPGISYGAAFVASGREAVLLGVCRQLIGFRWLWAPDFRYCGSLGPLALSAAQHEALGRLGRNLTETFGLRGLFGLDFILGPGGPYLLEVNPRYTASIEVLERTWSRSAVRLHLDACLHGILPDGSAACSGPMWGKAIVYAGRDGFVNGDFYRWVDARNREGRQVAVADIPMPAQFLRRGAPVVSLLTSGPDPDTIKARLRRQAACVRRLLRV